MTSYRRNYVSGGTYFFTVNLADRRQTLLTDHIAALRSALHQTRCERPFKIDAIVVLPDHLHTIWSLPQNDSDFSTRWRLIKTRFSRAIDISQPRGRSQRAKQERSIWQRRFWEHTIRNAQDHERLIAYCWINPIKHGYVNDPTDWSFSSIHRDLGKPWVQAPILQMPKRRMGDFTHLP